MFFGFLDSQIAEYNELLISNYKRARAVPGGGHEIQDCSDIIRGRLGCLKDIKNTEAEIKQHLEAVRTLKAKILELKKGA